MTAMRDVNHFASKTIHFTRKEKICTFTVILKTEDIFPVQSLVSPLFQNTTATAAKELYRNTDGLKAVCNI